MKKPRQIARELALNILYQVDACKLPFHYAMETALECADLSMLKTEERMQEAKDYARMLATGIKDHIEIDHAVMRHVKDWKFDRLAQVDKNILRIAIFEIEFVEDVDIPVSINEAVELAKKYSTEDSSRFVNGLLASFVREYEDKQKGQDTSGENS